MEIRFFRGRINFIKPDDLGRKDAPNLPSAVIIFRPPAGGVTYTASAAARSLLPSAEQVNTTPNKLYASLTDFAFPETP